MIARRASVPQTPFQQVHHLQEIAQSRLLTDAEVDQLSALASSQDWQIRCRALMALRKASTPEQKAKAVKVMRAALKDKEYVVRAYAVRGLGRIGDASDIPFILPLLKDPSFEVRKPANEALKKLGYQPQ